MEFGEEYKQFLQNLQQFPNYFQMGAEKISSNLWKNLITKINDEREELLKSSDLDQIKNQNLEACAVYYLGDVDKARTILSKVLEDTKSSSINACAMMAIICYRNGEISKAKRLLEVIERLGADPFNIDLTKSELAYAFTRLDATHYMKAIQFYSEAVERNPDNIPWKFGLATIYGRCMDPSVQALHPNLNIEICFKETKKHLEYVIEKCTDEKDLYYKASSYIWLAELYSTSNVIEVHFCVIIDLIYKGVQCLPDHTGILMRAGRLLICSFRFKEAEILLQKAYDICPNSFICHQLGWLKKKQIMFKKKSQIKRHSGKFGPIRKRRNVSVFRRQPFDLKLSKKLVPCVDLFRQSAELADNRNINMYYSWGLTLLQMTPTNFREVQEKFNYILDNDPSPLQRYRCYEQYGICKIRMSESPDIDEATREDCLQDSQEMFRRANRCLAYCQKMQPSKHFDDAECDHDVVIMFNDEDHTAQTIGANLKKWLNDFTKSNLTVAKSSEAAANLPKFQEKVKLLCNSKMAIFLIGDDNSSTEQIYLMNTALEAMCSEDCRLNKIFPLLIKDGNTPDIFKVFKSLKLKVEPNTDGDEQDREKFLKMFSELNLE